METFGLAQEIPVYANTMEKHLLILRNKDFRDNIK